MDAMTTARACRQALRVEQATGELLDQAGRQFERIRQALFAGGERRQRAAPRISVASSI
jgi:HD-GYP domain-containing protein (c-di-GMP phosphodiesterase class II)